MCNFNNHIAMLPIIIRVVDVNFGIIIVLYLSEILTSNATNSMLI